MKCEHSEQIVECNFRKWQEVGQGDQEKKKGEMTLVISETTVGISYVALGGRYNGEELKSVIACNNMTSAMTSLL